MFKSLFIGEIKKNLTKKAIIVMSVLILMFLLLSITVNKYTESIIKDAAEEDIILDNSSAMIFTESSVETKIEQTKIMIDEINNQVNSGSYLNDMLGIDVRSYKSQLIALEYIRDKKMFNTPVIINEGAVSTVMSSIFESSALGFASFFMSGCFAALMIYGIILAANAASKEFQTGTIKLVLMRPMSRGKLMAAKLMSTVFILSVMSLIVAVIGLVFGLLMFKNISFKVIYVFNHSVAFSGMPIGLFIIQYFEALISALGFAVLAFLVGILTRKPTPTVVIAILISLGFVQSLIPAQWGLHKFFFSYSAKFMSFFSTVPSAGANSNFFLALPLFLVYIGAMITGSYFVFNKRDIV